LDWTAENLLDDVDEHLVVLHHALGPTAAPAQFKGYFDVSHVQLPELQQERPSRRSI
jgi:hypothetical protein